jgi:hypothetical protein
LSGDLRADASKGLHECDVATNIRACP